MDIDLDKFSMLLDTPSIVKGYELVYIMSTPIDDSNISSVIDAYRAITVEEERKMAIDCIYSQANELNDCNIRNQIASEYKDQNNKFMSSPLISNAMLDGNSNISKDQLSLLADASSTPDENSNVSQTEMLNESMDKNAFQYFGGRILPNINNALHLISDSFGSYVQQCMKEFRQVIAKTNKAIKAESLSFLGKLPISIQCAYEYIVLEHYFLYQCPREGIQVNLNLANNSSAQYKSSLISIQLSIDSMHKCSQIEENQKYKPFLFYTHKCRSPQEIYKAPPTLTFKFTINDINFYELTLPYYFSISNNLEMMFYLLINWAEEHELITEGFHYYHWCYIIMLYLQTNKIADNIEKPLVPKFSCFKVSGQEPDANDENSKMIKIPLDYDPSSHKNKSDGKHKSKQPAKKESKDNNKKASQNTKVEAPHPAQVEEIKDNKEQPMAVETTNTNQEKKEESKKSQPEAQEKPKNTMQNYIYLRLVKTKSPTYAKLIQPYIALWNDLNNESRTKIVLNFFYFLCEVFSPVEEGSANVLDVEKGKVYPKRIKNPNKRDNTNIKMYDPIKGINLLKRTKKAIIATIANKAISTINALSKLKYDCFFKLDSLEVSISSILNKSVI